MTPGAQAAELLTALAWSVKVWRIQQLDSAVFYAEHGEVVSVEPLVYTGMTRRTSRVTVPDSTGLARSGGHVRSPGYLKK